jgi:hypothetical protein
MGWTAPRLFIMANIRLAPTDRTSINGPQAPPRFDPNFGPLGEVMVRDLALYEAASQSEGGRAR